MLFLVLLFLTFKTSDISLSSDCQPCYYGGKPISCGGIFNGQMCCNGVWCNCVGVCRQSCCPVMNYTQDTKPTHKYAVTNEGILYTKHVTKVIFNESTQTFYNETVHSSKLHVNDFVLWPAHHNMVNNNVVLSNKYMMVQLKYHNVNATRDNCCYSLFVEYPLSCVNSLCCGVACCC